LNECNKRVQLDRSSYALTNFGGVKIGDFPQRERLTGEPKKTMEKFEREDTVRRIEIVNLQGQKGRLKQFRITRVFRRKKSDGAKQGKI